MRKQAYALQRPSEVVFDIDTTILPTYGTQSGGESIHHYQEVCCHPMLCYDGNTGDLLKAELRKGSMYCGNGATIFIEPLLAEYEQEYPDVKLLVRGDSGFAMSDLYNIVEKHPDARHTIRLKDNVPCKPRRRKLWQHTWRIVQVKTISHHVLANSDMLRNLGARSAEWHIRQSFAKRMVPANFFLFVLLL